MRFCLPQRSAAEETEGKAGGSGQAAGGRVPGAEGKERHYKNEHLSNSGTQFGETKKDGSHKEREEEEEDEKEEAEEEEDEEGEEEEEEVAVSLMRCALCFPARCSPSGFLCPVTRRISSKSTSR